MEKIYPSTCKKLSMGERMDELQKQLEKRNAFLEPTEGKLLVD